MEKLIRRGLCPVGKRGSTPQAGVLPLSAVKAKAAGRKTKSSLDMRIGPGFRMECVRRRIGRTADLRKQRHLRRRGEERDSGGGKRGSTEAAPFPEKSSRPGSGAPSELRAVESVTAGLQRPEFFYL